MLAVENGCFGIKDDLASSARDQQVQPPVMHNGLCHARLHGQLFGGVVEKHGVAPSQTLHQGVAKTGRALVGF